MRKKCQPNSVAGAMPTQALRWMVPYRRRLFGCFLWRLLNALARRACRGLTPLSSAILHANEENLGFFNASRWTGGLEGLAGVWAEKFASGRQSCAPGPFQVVSGSSGIQGEVRDM
eukprot:jgi/Ulvmu1/5573/UM023_0110.1